MVIAIPQSTDTVVPEYGQHDKLLYMGNIGLVGGEADTRAVDAFIQGSGCAATIANYGSKIKVILREPQICLGIS